MDGLKLNMGHMKALKNRNLPGGLIKCLVKLVMTTYRLGEMSGGFGETSYDHL